MYLTLYDLDERISSVWLKFRFKKKKGSLKNFPWVPRLWVGRRQEPQPILGYISKIDGKINSGHKGLSIMSHISCCQTYLWRVLVQFSNFSNLKLP